MEVLQTTTVTKYSRFFDQEEQPSRGVWCVYGACVVCGVWCGVWCVWGVWCVVCVWCACGVSACGVCGTDDQRHGESVLARA